MANVAVAKDTRRRKYIIILIAYLAQTSLGVHAAELRLEPHVQVRRRRDKPSELFAQDAARCQPRHRKCELRVNRGHNVLSGIRGAGRRDARPSVGSDETRGAAHQLTAERLSARAMLISSIDWQR